MLYAERERLKALEEREASGEDVWTSVLNEPVRRKLWYLTKRAYSDDWLYDALNLVRDVVVETLGLKPALVTNQFGPVSDVEKAFINLNEQIVLSLLEACSLVLHNGPTHYAAVAPEDFEQSVNDVFRSHRLSYELVEGEVVPFESQELHTEIVAPALRLLSGRQGWEAVEQAYQGALKEIGDDPSDSITDAGTALQEALTLTGLQGNSLGKLAKHARKTGLLAPHDSVLNEAITMVIDWVSAERSEKGDGHKSLTGATPEDAWLAVHVVGALILRLASGETRAQDVEAQA